MVLSISWSPDWVCRVSIICSLRQAGCSNCFNSPACGSLNTLHKTLFLSKNIRSLWRNIRMTKLHCFQLNVPACSLSYHCWNRRRVFLKLGHSAAYAICRFHHTLGMKWNCNINHLGIFSRRCCKFLTSRLQHGGRHQFLYQSVLFLLTKHYMMTIVIDRLLLSFPGLNLTVKSYCASWETHRYSVAPSLLDVWK